MGSFAFILHPLDVSDVARKYPLAAQLPPRWVEWLLKRFLRPKPLSHIKGVRSTLGMEAEGWFVGCPLTARQMMEEPTEWVLARIVEAGRVAQELGARIVGLGAFTSVVGDGGITVARHLDIAVTTGNSYTVATAVEGARKAAELLGHSLPEAVAAVIGATGSIGRVCAHLLAPDVGELWLIGRNWERLEAVAQEVRERNEAKVRVSTDIRSTLPLADVVIAVTSALDTVVEPEDLKPGAVVADVARPRDVSRRVAEVREDVLVIEGGVVEVPGPVEFGFNFGFPPRTAYACMAETMILALEERYEPFSLGRELSVEKVQEIQRLAQRHGFRLAGFRSFERPVTEEQIARVRERAEQARRRKS